MLSLKTKKENSEDYRSQETRRLQADFYLLRNCRRELTEGRIHLC